MEEMIDGCETFCLQPVPKPGRKKGSTKRTSDTAVDEELRREVRNQRSSTMRARQQIGMGLLVFEIGAMIENVNTYV